MNDDRDGFIVLRIGFEKRKLVGLGFTLVGLRLVRGRLQSGTSRAQIRRTMRRTMRRIHSPIRTSQAQAARIDHKEDVVVPYRGNSVFAWDPAPKNT